MAVYKETLKLNSHGGTPSYINITKEVREAIKKSGIKEGICTVISPHTTCSVFFEEYVHDITKDGDEFLQADLNDCLERIMPCQTTGDTYRYPGPAHMEAVCKWPDISKYLPTNSIRDIYNGDAHLRATLIGSSETFEVANGELGVGVTGYVYFVDFDRTHPRERKCKIVVIGE